jgi:type IV pilus assembly protein PilB
MRLGDALVEEGLLSEEQLKEALRRQKDTGRPLGELLVDTGVLAPEQILEALSRRLGVPGARLRSGMADPNVLRLVDREEAGRLKVLPLFKVRDTLTVAMAEPQSLPTIDRLRAITKLQIRPVLALEDDIRRFLRGDGPAGELDNVLAALTESQLEMQSDEPETDVPAAVLEAQGEGGPVINLVNAVLLRAITQLASDVHIEPGKEHTLIRYRIDGRLCDVMRPPAAMHAAIVSRIKVVGRMNIAERRLPQEGRVRLVNEGKEVDMRISSMPTVLGEKLVIRLLDKSNLRVRLEDLGLRPEQMSALLRMLHRPHGLVLVTGPTGSGKTTTLYSALSVICNTERNVLTVEDPVEYQIERVNQIQVQDAIGMTFARALRSILRQDPDIIMVGEVRDAETARVAVQASLTGHLVLATLHTNDAPGAIARLTDMGVEPYLLSGCLNGGIAQRLVRVICQRCAEAYTPSDELIGQAGLADRKGLNFWRGKGCPDCRGSGYSGRVGVFEVMEVDTPIRRLIHTGQGSIEIRETWLKSGGIGLRAEGIRLAVEGRTTLEEVLYATYGDDDAAPPAQIAAEKSEK